ncbi:MAG: hypothetical protein H0W06_12855 [Chloroflexia bacterium]|nr:hypothetical protein [Chloroflexia bacterium]
MSLQKRKCSSCRFLADATLPGNGWCTHPKRQVSSDVRILVRKGELACRNNWGADLWEPAAGSGARDMNADTPPADQRLVLTSRQLHDEVTSVVDAEARQTQSAVSESTHSREGVDDQIVEQGSLRGEVRKPMLGIRPVGLSLDEVNHPAHADQQERAEDMARGEKHAIRRARERHRRRNGGPARLDTSPPLSVNEQDLFDDRETHSTPRDDSAREEISAPTREFEDKVLGTRQRPEPTVEIDRVQRKYNDAAPPVPPSELPSGAEHAERRDEDRARFESVPPRRDDIVLPRRAFSVGDSVVSSESDGSAPDPDSSESGLTSYDRVLEQARQIKAAAKAAREGRPTRQIPRLAPLRQERPGDATSTDAASSEGPAEGLSSPDQTMSSAHPSADPDQSVAPRMEPLPLRPADPVTEDDVRGARNIVNQASNVPGDNTDVPPELYRVERSEIEWSEDGIDLRPRHRTTRRRSWLGSFGRRHQDTPPKVAHFPLRSARISSDNQHANWSDDPPAHVAEPRSLAVDATSPRSDHDVEESDEHPPDDVAGSSHAGVTVLHQHQSGETSRRIREVERDQETSHPAHATFVEQSDSQDEPIGPHPSPESDVLLSLRDAGDQPQDDLKRIVSTDDMAKLRERLFGALTRNQMMLVERRTPITSYGGTELLDPGGPVSKDAPVDDDLKVHESPDSDSRDQIDIRALVARQGDLLDMRVQLAPHVPRVCETCRDFRPAENGERGWCTNPWAFTHRRMVNAADRPCQSSIGCWWLPEDGVWLTGNGDSPLDGPTPLMDAMLAIYERRRVGER